MSLELFRRVKVLEGKLDDLERRLNLLLAPAPVVVTPAEPPQRKKIQKVCPHCNAAPAYHFHVMNCAKKQKQQNGQNGSSGAT